MPMIWVGDELVAALEANDITLAAKITEQIEDRKAVYVDSIFVHIIDSLLENEEYAMVKKVQAIRKGAVARAEARDAKAKAIRESISLESATDDQIRMEAIRRGLVDDDDFDY